MHRDEDRILDRLADEFEAAWQSGARRDVAEFLDKVAGPLREELAQLLIPIDIEYRLRAGEMVEPALWQELGPVFSTIAANALRERTGISDAVVLARFDAVNRDDPRQDQGGKPAGEDLAPTLDASPRKARHDEPNSRATPTKGKDRQIGPYRLVQRLGAGGMGEVWVAEQSEPVKREVALKLIQAGKAAREYIARFEAERQALALMNHPNIAKILDAGATEDGQPFYVMELVAGTPLTKFCDDRLLSIDERLELFMDVCAGVQHAHQKGIVHRDLKPGNIIVGEVDGKPVPKVIDFGLAKAMESAQQLTEDPDVTAIGQLLGTLKYMSPEQAGLDNLDIDTRADIYALGVILYELLTGSTPLDDSSIRGQTQHVVLEFIREKEPVKPSSRLSDSTGDQLSSITGPRQTDSSRLKRILLGDLDWIVMKALEKDRTRRYESASGFAADIRRFLNSEPVLARPPSLKYRIRKFVRKNRVGVIATVLTGLALVGGILGTALGLLEANRQSRVKDDALAEEQRQRRYAEAINQFVRDDFFALTSEEGQARFGNDIAGDLNPNMTVVQLLERAAKKLEKRSDLEPLIDAELNWMVGVNLRALGRYERALPFLRRASVLRNRELGIQHEKALIATHSLAVCLASSGKSNESIKLADSALETSRLSLGPEHPVTLAYLNSLACGYTSMGEVSKAVPLFERVLELRIAVLGEDHLHTIQTQRRLGDCLLEMGRLPDALQLLRQAERRSRESLGDVHRDTLRCRGSLADCLVATGEIDEGLALLESTVDVSISCLGPEDPDAMTLRHSLAAALETAGKTEAAIDVFEELIGQSRSILGPKHPDTVRTMANLAVCYRKTRQLDRAIPLLEAARNGLCEAFGKDHPDTLTATANLGSIWCETGNHEQGLPMLEEALDKRQATLGHEHRDTMASVVQLASGYHHAGRHDEAIPLFDRAMDLYRDKLGSDHPEALVVMNNLATCCWRAGHLHRSIPLFEETLRMRTRTLGRQHLQTQRTLANLGVNYLDAGRPAEALPILEEAFEASHQWPQLKWVRRSFQRACVETDQKEAFRELAEAELKAAREEHPAHSLELVDTLLPNADGYLKLGLFSEASNLLRETVHILRDLAPEDWRTFDVQSKLGGALLGQAAEAEKAEDKARLWGEAEPLLVAGYIGIRTRSDSVTPLSAVSIPAALDRLIELYTVLEKPEEVEKYRKLRAEYPAAMGDKAAAGNKSGEAGK